MFFQAKFREKTVTSNTKIWNLVKFNLELISNLVGVGVGVGVGVCGVCGVCGVVDGGGVCVVT